MKEEKPNQSISILFNEWIGWIWFVCFSSPPAIHQQFKNVLIVDGRRKAGRSEPFTINTNQIKIIFIWIGWLINEWAQWARSTTTKQAPSNQLFHQSSIDEEIDLLSLLCWFAAPFAKRNQTINQSIKPISFHELVIDDCCWFRWRWLLSAGNTSTSFQSVEAFPWAANCNQIHQFHFSSH